MHGFGTQKFANRTAQHGPAIAHAGIGRAAGALELDFLRSLWRFKFTQQDGPAVAQLSGPHTKLMAAVNTGQRPGAGELLVAGQGGQRLSGLQPIFFQAQLTRQGAVAADPIGRRKGAGFKPGVEILAQPGKTVDPFQAGAGRV
jgi:hypothetical protein